jgi:hypothetical protein
MVTIQSQAEIFKNTDAVLARADVFLNISIWRISANSETQMFPSLDLNSNHHEPGRNI